ncbi:hypothetical protein NLJ89_g6221 [Agrocybe chaxingu]|uniref:Uncharacterized protein n=1 Tax=Agrocybe chaxingu TaxID=84603 RepID=A0A9W8JZN8_9AGAR|nr:hypothetical protein NLJ89_g6221 [Agrocybe chaxingu]
MVYSPDYRYSASVDPNGTLKILTVRSGTTISMALEDSIIDVSWGRRSSRKLIARLANGSRVTLWVNLAGTDIRRVRTRHRPQVDPVDFSQPQNEVAIWRGTQVHQVLDRIDAEAVEEAMRLRQFHQTQLSIQRLIEENRALIRRMEELDMSDAGEYSP